MFIILMGVSGSGKTTVGKALAHELGWAFFDGDDYHLERNVAKMRSGIPLTDDDRRDWLLSLAKLISDNLGRSSPGVLACSALKQQYRDLLSVDPEGVKFVYLKGTRELISARLHDRTEHFMKAGLLDSQFDALEEPLDALTVDINLSPEEIAELIVGQFQLKNH